MKWSKTKMGNDHIIIATNIKENKKRIQKMKQEILLMQAKEKEENRDETRLVRGARVEYELKDNKEDIEMNGEKKDSGCLITILVSILTALVTNWVLKGWL